MAKKMGFSAGMASAPSLNISTQKSLVETNAKREFNLQYIPKDKIIPNQLNKKYSQEDIESLKESIRLEGLRHNLCVMYNVDEDNYRLVSGERRYRAICMLEEKDYVRLFPSGIPAKVEKADISEIDEEIMLIKANSEKREETPELKRWEVIRLNELYEAKRQKGEEIPNIARAISKTMGMSERMTKNYLATQNLIPELEEILNQRGITVTDGAAIASLPDEAQHQLYELLKQTGTIDKSDITALKAAEDEKKRIAKELEKAQKELKEKNVRIQVLETQIDKTEKSKKDMPQSEKNIAEDEVEELRREKEYALKEKEKAEEKLRKLQESQKERESRNIDVSEKELKRLSALAKLDQTITSLENEISVLKTNKAMLIEDEALRERARLILERLHRILS